MDIRSPKRLVIAVLRGFDTPTIKHLQRSQRSTGELASYQKKLIRIDDHIGVAIAGLTSDARVLRWVSVRMLACIHTARDLLTILLFP